MAVPIGILGKTSAHINVVITSTTKANISAKKSGNNICHKKTKNCGFTKTKNVAFTSATMANNISHKTTNWQ